MYDKESTYQAFSRWETHLKEQSLPKWEELPDIELYMDQVLILVNRHIGIFNTGANAPQVTAPMINNYVKQKTVPAPVNKKYGKVHLAYLIMVCTLKQALNIATIEKLIPFGLEEARVKEIYNSFVQNQIKAFQHILEQVKQVSDPILAGDDQAPERVRDLVFQVAVASNVFRTLTEQITE